MTPQITQAGRSGWQRQAAGELASILEACAWLPAIAWTVGPGGGLTGSIGGLAPAASVRAAFTAWQQALALGDVAETATGGGTSAWLRARAWHGGIRVIVTATVFTVDEAKDTAVTS